MAVIVTRESLRELFACQQQVDLFTETFGSEVKATLGRLRQAARIGLDIDWWFRNAFPHRRAKYDRKVDALRAKYRQQRDTLWAEHDRKVDALRAEYRQQAGALWAEYDQQAQQTDALWEKYYRRVDALLVEHNQQVNALRAECRQQTDTLLVEYDRQVISVIWRLIQ